MNKKIIHFGCKKILIKDYIICSGVFSKIRGLMFRPKNFRTPLLFVFKKPKRCAIHSFFCRKFLAIWMLKGRIVDMKIIKSWRVAVTPKEKFDEFLEIPIIPSG